MAEENILIIGAGILDVLVCPADAEGLKKGSVAVETIKISTGGDGLNEATVIARLKHPFLEENPFAVRLLTVTGEDEAGRIVWDHCQKEKISMDLSLKEQEIETGINIVMIAQNGERSFFTNPAGSLRRLSVRHIPEVFPEDVKILCFASIFVSPLFTGKELAEIFRRAKRQGICVCADMTKCKNGEKAEDISDALSLVDYLFANEEEAGLVTGKSTAEEMAAILRGYGVKNVVIKCGKRGCYAASASIEGWFGPAKVGDCIDTTGAGDSFAAGFLCALSEGRDFVGCIRWANACGSLAVEAVGACTGIKGRNQVLGRIKELPY